MPCRNVTDSERENSNLVNVGEYKSLLGTLLYIVVYSPDLIYLFRSKPNFKKL
jgi:hypothetical protein